MNSYNWHQVTGTNFRCLSYIQYSVLGQVVYLTYIWQSSSEYIVSIGYPALSKRT